MRIDLPQARAALHAAAERSADLLGTIPDGARPVNSSDWTIAEVGAHLVFGLRGFTDAAQGSFDSVMPYIPDTELFRDRLTAVTTGTLALIPERHPGVLSTLVIDAAEKFLAVTDGRSPGEPIHTPWYGTQASLSLAEATGLLAGEQIIHGYDIATTLRRRWPITPADARLILPALATGMIPKAVNPATTHGHTANYDVRVRGGPRFTVHFRDGTATTGPANTGPVDCHLWADPVDMLLVVYGRISQYRPIARGQLRTWGRKPWLALSFKNRFYNP